MYHFRYLCTSPVKTLTSQVVQCELPCLLNSITVEFNICLSRRNYPGTSHEAATVGDEQAVTEMESHKFLQILEGFSLSSPEVLLRTF